jgi:hypothetical protein
MGKQQLPVNVFPVLSRIQEVLAAVMGDPPLCKDQGKVFEIAAPQINLWYVPGPLGALEYGSGEDLAVGDVQIAPTVKEIGLPLRVFQGGQADHKICVIAGGAKHADVSAAIQGIDDQLLNALIGL